MTDFISFILQIACGSFGVGLMAGGFVLIGLGLIFAALLMPQSKDDRKLA